jgi:hypothetical protein
MVVNLQWMFSQCRFDDSVTHGTHHACSNAVITAQRKMPSAYACSGNSTARNSTVANRCERARAEAAAIDQVEASSV